MLNELHISPKIDANGNHGLQIRVITDEAEFFDLKNDWNSLVEESNTTVFQTFEWNKTWWKYFGAGNTLNIIAVFDDHQLIGIFPLFIDTVTIAGIEMYSALRLLGSSVSDPEGQDLKGLLPYSDYLDAIVRPGFEEAFFQTVLDYFQKTRFCYHQIILDEIPQQSAIIGYLTPLFARHQMDFSISDASVCVAITLEKSWEEYLDHLSKRSRYHVRKYLKKAYHPDYKVFDIEYVQNVACLGPVFDELVRLHQQRWNGTGYPGTFAEQRFLDFMKDITKQFMNKGWAKLKVVRSSQNKEYLAVDLLFEFNKTVSLSLRAYDIYHELNIHGPGNVLLYQTVKDGIEEGYEVLDFMRGKESYKFRSANDFRINRTITISNSDRFAKISDLLIRKMIIFKRRMTFEREAIAILFRNKKLYRGIADYGTFLQKRLMTKLRAPKKEYDQVED